MPNKPTLASTLSRPDEITVLVFKDNDASRGFQVSLGWISRLGLALGLMVAATLLGTFFAVKFYRVARRTDPSHVVDLEQQLTDLRASNKALEAKLAAVPATAPVPAATVAAQVAANPMPVPTVTVTVTATPAPAPAVNLLTQSQAPPASPSTEGLPLFSALPRGTTDATASASKLPITVSPAHASWSSSGRTFKVDFEIQYVGTDHGSQQGRIIVLARGPNALFAYPQGVLSRAGTESLISPKQGEYFSVSRFRQVKAEFTDVKGTGTIQDVEILIMSLEGQLLFYQKIQPASHPGGAPAAPKPAAPAKTAPAKPATPAQPATQAPGAPAQSAAPAPAKPPAASDSSELIEPGVDQ